jgi:hypothetical protein
LLPFLLAELFRPSPEGAAGMTARIEGLRPKVESLVDFRALEDPLYVLVAATLLSFVTAGLREELWRAGFMAALRDLLPRRLAEPGGRRPGENRFVWQCRLRLPDVLLSLAAATVFGLGHLPQGVGGVVLTGVVGFILGLVMILHRSLWTAVIAHGFFDATTFVLLGLIVRYREEIRKIAPDMLRQIGL